LAKSIDAVPDNRNHPLRVWDLLPSPSGDNLLILDENHPTVIIDFDFDREVVRRTIEARDSSNEEHSFNGLLHWHRGSLSDTVFLVFTGNDALKIDPRAPRAVVARTDYNHLMVLQPVQLRFQDILQWLQKWTGAVISRTMQSLSEP
jgi:hypothetical protein